MLLTLAILVPRDAPQDPPRLPAVIVEGRADNLVGVAGSASEGMTSAEDLRLRPLLRPAEVLETVPGLVVTQHSGAGKGNQMFVRGFDLDHGTDLATSLFGMPQRAPPERFRLTCLDDCLPSLAPGQHLDRQPWNPATARTFWTTPPPAIAWRSTNCSSVACRGCGG